MTEDVPLIMRGASQGILLTQHKVLIPVVGMVV